MRALRLLAVFVLLAAPACLGPSVANAITMTCNPGGVVFVEMISVPYSSSESGCDQTAGFTGTEFGVTFTTSASSSHAETIHGGTIGASASAIVSGPGLHPAEFQWGILNAYRFTVPGSGGTVPFTITISSTRDGGASNPVVRGAIGLGTGIQELLPGTHVFDLVRGQSYTIDLSLNVQMGTTGSASATLTFVPEPGSALLVGLGLAALAARRRARAA